MQYSTKCILLCILLSAPISAHSQVNTFSGWVNFINNFKLNEHVSIHFDAQIRKNAESKNLQGFLLRPGIIFRINKHLTAGAGYALINNHRSIDFVSGFTPEHIIWEQLVFINSVGFVIMTNRLRLEQRFIYKPVVQNNTFHNVRNVFANRLRYSVRGLFPLNGSKVFQKGFYAVLQNEVLVNIGNASSLNGKFFDQNRASIGCGHRFSKKLDIELSYINQYISRRNSLFTNNQILQLATFMRL